MKSHHLTLLAFAALLTSAPAQYRVSPAAPYAHGANIGWVNASAATGSSAVRLGPCVCAGFLYSANCGWINLGSGAPANGVQYTDTTGQDSGVNVMPGGALRGLAWGANIGWINFEATGNPRIAGNQFTGMAWSASTGWLCLDTTLTDLLLISGDTENDGIPDAWELLHAPDLAVLGAETDNDADGQNDAAEYAADTDPLDAASVLRIVHFAMPPAGPTGTLRWTSQSTRQYRIETSADLTGWSFLPGNAIHGADFGLTTYAVPRGGSRSFYRVLALKPPAGE